MGTQLKLSTVSIEDTLKKEIGLILELEKKYQSLLWKIFSSRSFVDDLIFIENEIIKNYSYLSANYDIKNKFKIPAERLARYYIYNSNLNNGLNVKNIFPSPISGDLAFITEDAVINIDIKTLDINGNRNDIGNLQFLPNQSSFEHINVGTHPNYSNSGINVGGILPKKYNKLPVLTYFLTLVYDDNPSQNAFSISRNNEYKTIHLINLPNGITSCLFENELLNNFKTYNYFKAKNGFQPVLLQKNSNLKSANDEVIRLFSQNQNYSLFNMGSKVGCLDLNNYHPNYGTLITWVPVSRKNGAQYDFYLEAISSGDTNRVDEKKLKVRFDSVDSYWLGLNTLTIE
jgi:hypothetical protein